MNPAIFFSSSTTRIFKLSPLNLRRLVANDAGFPHPGAKGAGVETKEYRRAVFPFYAPPGFQENLVDVVVFQLGKGFYFLPCQISGLGKCAEAVHDLKSGSLAGDYRPLNDAFQLPHIAGPMVFPKGVQGVP